MSETTGPADLGFDAVLFDLDGVVTRTAELHAAAWAELFERLRREGKLAQTTTFDPAPAP